MIEVVNLTKRYRGNPVVDGLSFSVRPGTVTGFLGPNGSGKTTTARMIVGLTVPDAGLATIGGRPYRDLAYPLREIGVLLNPGAVNPARTAIEHLRWLAAANRLPSARAGQVLGMVGLDAAAGRKVGCFSLGMRQRLGIAVALIGDPATLLLDEPINGLDPEGIRWIRTFLQGLADEGRTVFVSSHLMSEMALTATELVVIGRGRLIAAESVASFVARVESTVRVRSPQLGELEAALRDSGATVWRSCSGAEAALEVVGMSIEHVGSVAGRTGAVLYELSAQHASLEDAFMRLTGELCQYPAEVPGAAAAGGPAARPVAGVAA